jgi:hypothetical protein
MRDLRSPLDGFASPFGARRGAFVPPEFPTANALALWLFAEGTGATVSDEIGSADINLALPTDPNYTWTAQGISLANGLIQTPSITGAREIVILYRTGFDQTPGFLISGGSGSGTGITQNAVIPAETNRYAGSGYGWRSVAARADNGTGANELNRGGWGLLSRTMTSAFNTPFGLGGRHTATTSRCANFEIAMAAVFSAPTTEEQREALLTWARWFGAQRGIYFHKDDAPIKRRVAVVIGESNADGRAKIVDLTAGQQATNYAGRVEIIATNGTTHQTAFATLALGTNQQTTAPTTDFGPEIGAALAAHPSGLPLRIIKAGRGGTYMTGTAVSTPTGAAPAGTSWTPGELPTNAIFFDTMLRRVVWRGLQLSLNEGIGWAGIKWGLWIGLNDAANTTFTVSAADYQARLQAFWDAIKARLPGTGHELVLFRAHASDPGSNATALGHVRTASDAFAAANPDVSIVDTDALGRQGDNVHYNAAANITMGGMLV